MTIAEENQQSPCLYLKLDETKAQTRLVTIEKASDSDALDIRCQLSVVSMQNEPSYIALSYVWGDPNITESIFVNGVPLSITTNLASALRHLRERYKEEIAFWIDAICINQQDLDERGSQVKIMGDIYSGAEKVVAWLGKADAGTSKLFGLLNAETGNINPNRNWSEIEQNRKAIKDLFNRPYWVRMWTQQEGILARNLLFVCGAESTPVENVLKFINVCLYLRANTYRMRELKLDEKATWDLHHALNAVLHCGMLIFRHSFGPERRAPTLIHLLGEAEGCDAGDPRDKLYALLGVDRNHELGIEPNYKKDVVKVYAEFIQQVVKKHSRLVLNGSNGVGAVRINQERIPGLPSWVPDFTRRNRNLCDHFQPWDTPIDIKPDTEFSNDGLTLIAKGLVIDRVDEYELEEAEDFNRRRWWALACRDGQKTTYPTGIPRIQAYFRTLIFAKPGAGHADDEEFFQLAVGFMLSMMQLNKQDPGPSPKFFKFHRMLVQQFGATEKQIGEILTRYGWHVNVFIQMTGALDHLTEACIKASGLQGIADMSEQTFLEGFCGPESDPNHLKWVRRFDVPEDGMELHIKFGSHINLHLTHDAFFTTPNGYMGLGPKGVQQGDLVCVLFGCQQPLVLRPVEDHYIVVGSCYVNGISGESISRLSALGFFNQQQFEIR
ncbi:heterokaryon incompatibility protein-domain-containing protein [Xylaria flabelliformis]|nr:heterokaryon incompatibility protein-domain-containing protein [Xylaria flabelliformis]